MASLAPDWFNKFFNTHVQNTLTHFYIHLHTFTVSTMAISLSARIDCNIFPNIFFKTLWHTFTKIYTHLPPPHWQWPLQRGLVVIHFSIPLFKTLWHTFTEIYTHLLSHIGNGHPARIGCIKLLNNSVQNNLKHFYNTFTHIYPLHTGNGLSGTDWS